MIENPSMAGWIKVWEKERDALTDRYAIAMVDLVIEHSVYEAERNWDAVMATVTDDAVYHATGHGIDGVRVSNKDEQRKVYEAADAAIPGFISGLEMDQDRFVVGPDSVAFDGRLYRILTGAQLPSRNVLLPEGASANDEFLVSWRMACFIPFRDGLMTGEDTYAGKPRIEKRIEPQGEARSG